VTVVYGRIASDNEIVAIKTAGLSAWTVLRPAILLGVVASGLLFFLSSDLIPLANHYAAKVIFKNLEDYFYKVIKKDREFNNPRWPVLIKARDVEGKTLLDATFMHRAPGGEPNSYDTIIKAKKAVIQFDLVKNVARVHLEDAEIQQSGRNQDVMLIRERKMFEMPMPSAPGSREDKKIQELTSAEMNGRQSDFRRLILHERKRQALAAALWLGTGRPGRIDWGAAQQSFVNYQYWEQKCNALRTEQHLRVALAAGSLFFVVLGAPVGILFARRDFLSAFITCFVPIILIYYPLTLLGVNMGKEGILHPSFVFTGNAVLGLLAAVVAIPPVVKH